MQKMEKAYKILVVKPEKKDYLGQRCRWKNDTGMDRKE
jgi:hypothetical protein